MFIAHLLYAALGGAIGSALRFSVGYVALRWLGSGLPWGTFTVNLIGSLIMGIVIGWFSHKGSLGNGPQVFLATGILGGFTTFSAFSLEVANMVQRKDYTLAGLYAGSSVLFGLIMILAGLFIARKVFA